MPRAFAISWDYRCPFARNAHEHVLAGLAAGADWDVTFVPFSLGQVHVAEGEPPVWERPLEDSGLLALMAGTYVRDHLPDTFLDVHRALFALRHDHAGALKDPEAVRGVLAEHLTSDQVDAVFAAIESGEAVAAVPADHEAAVAGPGMWGVPTFVVDDRAVFVRIMDRNRGETDDERKHGRETIERILDLLDWTELNEFKHTRIPR